MLPVLEFLLVMDDPGSTSTIVALGASAMAAAASASVVES
jgi:hypothetical protein